MCLRALQRCACFVTTERWRRCKRFITYFIIVTNFFLGGFEYGIIFPTALDYLQSLGASDGRDTLYFSLLIVCYAVANIVGGYVGGLWADALVETRPLLVLAAVPQIAGNALYFCAASPDQLVLSRALSGVGSGANTAMIAEITRTTALRHRTSVISVITFARQVGIVFGPAAGARLIGLPDVFRHKLTLLNAPGFLMTLLYIGYLLLLTVGYSNLTVDEDEREFDEGGTRRAAAAGRAPPEPAPAALDSAEGETPVVNDDEAGSTEVEDVKPETTVSADEGVADAGAAGNPPVEDVAAPSTAGNPPAEDVGAPATAETAAGPPAEDLAAPTGVETAGDAQADVFPAADSAPPAADSVVVEPPPTPEPGRRHLTSVSFEPADGAAAAGSSGRPPLLLALPCAASPQVHTSWPPYHALDGWRTPASTQSGCSLGDEAATAGGRPPPPPAACPHCGKSLLPPAAPPGQSMVSEWRALLHWPVLVVLVCNFAAYVATCSLEASLPSLVEHDLHLDIGATGTVFTAGGVVQCVVLLLIMLTPWMPCLVDQRLIVAGLTIMALAHVQLTFWLVRLRAEAADLHAAAGYKPGPAWFWLLVVGSGLQFLGYPLVNSVATSFLSKLLSRGAQGVGAAGLRVSMCAGLMLGPLWGAGMLHRQLALLLVPLLVLVASLAAFSATERRGAFVRHIRAAVVVDLVTLRVEAAPRRVRTISTLTRTTGRDGAGSPAVP